MESELKVIAITPKPADPRPERDDRPLLRPETRVHETYVAVPQQSIDDIEKKYAAFVRNDVYGIMGRGELAWAEKILLGFGLLFLFPVRVVVSLIMLVIYYVICRVCTAFAAPNWEDEQEDYAHMGGWRRTVIVHSGRLLARFVLFVFGFYWISETSKGNEVDGQLYDEIVTGNQSEELESAGVIVSNHISYLDILYHMSSSFPSFVAKRSVGKLPLVGLISKCLGCIYVQRESKTPNFKGVSGVVNERIQEAHRNKFAPKMMLFPEGTTTNGHYLLPFKTGAFLANAPVLPIILRYPYQRFSPAWDSISGVRHVILLLCQVANYMEVKHLPVYHPSEQEKDDPKLYAENIRQLMAREGGLILSDIGLEEKRTYHAALNGLFSQS